MGMDVPSKEAGMELWRNQLRSGAHSRFTMSVQNVVVLNTSAGIGEQKRKSCSDRKKP
jgi:hypothetical protein